MFEILWDEKAFDELNKLEPSISRRILGKVKDLSGDPHIHDIKKLKGMSGFRLRVGDYRVIFEIEQDKIHIFKVGHRKHIYDK